MVKLTESEVYRLGANRYFDKHWKLWIVGFVGTLLLALGLGYLNEWLVFVGIVPMLCGFVVWIRDSGRAGKALVDEWKDAGVNYSNTIVSKS